MKKLFYIIFAISILINGCKNNIEEGIKGKMKNQLINSEGLLKNNTETQKDYKEALELFKLQIQCVVDDDRETQMGIYSKDLHYEFPFATDRPKIIEGRDTFKKIMQPIWERRRKNNVQLSLEKYEFHATDEPDLFLAVFVFKAVINVKSEPIFSPYIQLIRIRDKQIIEVREYFGP
jgi:ketosteroid isomerase-like protein